MKVIDDDDASLLLKIGTDGFPLRGTVTRARDYNSKRSSSTDGNRLFFSFGSFDSFVSFRPLFILVKTKFELSVQACT